MNPLLIFKTIGVSVGISGGITGSIFSSFQAFTKISIEEFLKDDWATYSEDADWKLLKGILDDSQNTDEEKLKLTGLEGIKKDTGDTNGEKVKTWCSTKKSFKIKKLLPSSFESLLLDYVRSFCLLTIGEKLTPSNQFSLSDSGNETLNTNTEKLNNHSDKTNGDLSKEPKLNEIKSKDSDKKEALLSWCLSSYKKTYKNSEDNLWKLTNRYCNKTKAAS